MTKIQNLDRLVKRLNNLKNIKIESVIEDASARVRDEARKNAPVDKAELQNSIRYKVEKSANEKVVGVIFTNKEYASYVEFGTGPTGAANNSGISPNVSPRYSPDGWVYYDDELDKWWFTKGQKAQPYMYPALNNNRKALKKFIQSQLKVKIREVIK